MYSNIIATREFAWAPSSGVLGGNDVNLGTSKANIDGTYFKEGNDDSEKDGILNLDTEMSQMVGGVNMSSNSNTKSSRKRKNEVLLRFEVERRKHLELVFSCCQGRINYLRVYRLGMIQLL